MTYLPDGSVSFDARYLIKADNGDIIEITNRGYRHGSPEVMQKMANLESVDPSAFYMRLAPRFDAPDGPHKWLTRTIFVGSAIRGQKQSTFHYWAVM